MEFLISPKIIFNMVFPQILKIVFTFISLSYLFAEIYEISQNRNLEKR